MIFLIFKHLPSFDCHIIERVRKTCLFEACNINVDMSKHWQSNACVDRGSSRSLPPAECALPQVRTSPTIVCLPSQLHTICRANREPSACVLWSLCCAHVFHIWITITMFFYFYFCKFSSRLFLLFFFFSVFLFYFKKYRRY